MGAFNGNWRGLRGIKRISISMFLDFLREATRHTTKVEEYSEQVLLSTIKL